MRSLAHAGNHQDLAVQLVEAVAQHLLHRIDLDLARAPPQRVVVRGRHAAAEHVDHEALVHRRYHNLAPDAALLELVHDVARGDCERRQLLPRVGIEHGQVLRAPDISGVQQVHDRSERRARILPARPGHAPVFVLATIGL